MDILATARGQGRAIYFGVHFTSPALACRTLQLFALGAERERAPGTISPAAVPPGGSLNILVAEDNHVNQRIAVAMLEKIGHRVTLASDGADAIAQWRMAASI
jgi:hypothetical protein